MRKGLILSGAILLAACGQQGTTGGTTATAAAPVAGKAPPAGKQWTEVVSATPEGGYRMGNPDAPLKLIEYGSRACPYCAKFDAEGYPALKDGLIKQGKLSYEFRDYPIHGALDLAPTLLGHCVDPDAFFPMLDQMMSNQQTLLANAEQVARGLQGQPAPQTALGFAQGLGYLDFVKQRGLPEAKARACLADQKAIQAIADRYQAANQQYNVSGTPTFILNGRKLENVGDWAQLQPALKAAGG
ncbi:MAG: DsbA family protein [Sphingomonas sp.]|uniref:DsbA family protein n=1 Tax=Sphingomonas sp. TaxID=28214 RepID=UPI0025F4ED46|nr:thioredoxin domain-containing protein [Sphingomonas sp.]MBX9881744.1 DsbA family protein [Sphingomonas sp.]